MKKIVFLCLLVIAISLAGCSTSTSYELYYGEEDIAYVEICNVLHDPNSASSLLSEYEVLSVLTDEQTAQLIEKLKTADCDTYWNDPPLIISGNAIFIHYENGKIEILSATGCGLFSGNIGEYSWRYFREDELNRLIGDYMS